MKRTTFFMAVLLLVAVASADAEFGVGTEVSFSYMDTERTYFIFEPPDLGESQEG